MPRSTLRRFAAILVCALALGGCALSEGYKYDSAPLSFTSLSSSVPVSLAVHDLRPYVVSGNKPERFVGLLRGGYGNPFDVATASGKPLAADMRDAAARAMKERGVNVTAVDAKPSDPHAQVKQRLQGTNARKHVLVTLNEWKTDSLINTSLYYDVTATVFDGRGNALASKRMNGEDALGGTMGVGPQDRIVAGFARRFNELFSDPQIVKALK